MGMTNVKLRVKNPQRPSKEYVGRFLVDSGAIFTVVPEDELKSLGIKPVREEDFELADGEYVTRKIGNALFEYKGIQGAAPVVFGEEGDTKLLGAFTLEALGLSLDPLKRELYKATLRL